MGFQFGHKKIGGAVKGSKKKRTVEYLQVLEQKNFCPASALIQCYQDARKTYENYGTIYEALCESRDKAGIPFPTEDKADKYLKIASDIAKDLASYAYPKLKAIEHEKKNPLSHMTPVQKLEAMKQAVLILEMEIKNGS